MPILIKRADISNLSLAHSLFTAYRDFYHELPTESSFDFLKQRIEKKEAIVLLALDETEKDALGFTLLYPSFDSLSLSKTYILHDLFVAPSHREKGVGHQLLEAARQYAKADGATSISLTTQITNQPAQQLYYSSGYLPVKNFLSFSLKAL